MRNVQVSTLDEYFAAADEREPMLRAMDAVIQESTGFKPVLFGGMTSKMIGYGMQPYQTKSMKAPGEWPLVALANQKQSASLYLCAVEDGQYIVEKHAAELGRVSCGKSCIRFKNFSDLNIDKLKSLLAEVSRRMAAGEKLFGV